MCRRVQKLEVDLAKYKLGLPLFFGDLNLIFGSNVGNEFGVMLRIKDFANQSLFTTGSPYTLTIYRDSTEFIIFRNTKTLLLRCFPFISHPTAGDINTTGEYITFHKFTNLLFRPLLKIPYHTFHNDLGDTSTEKKLVCIYRFSSSCFDVYENLQQSFITKGTLQVAGFERSRYCIL